jgi:hypothetical protein
VVVIVAAKAIVAELTVKLKTDAEVAGGAENWQRLPLKPGMQEQELAAMQVPPFWHEV